VTALDIDWFTRPEALPAEWDHRVAGADPTLQRAYLEAFAAAPPPGVDSHFGLVRRGEAVVAAAAFQVVSLEIDQLGTLVSEGPALIRLFLRLLGVVRGRPPRLLLCGNALHSDAAGLAVGAQEPEPVDLLHRATEDLRGRIGAVDAVVLTDPDAGGGGSALAERGYHVVSRTQPTMRVPLDPTWSGWDDYLAALHKKYRQRARSARKKGRGLERERLDADGIAAHLDTLDQLLAPVMERADLVVKRFPVATVAALERGLGDRVRVVLYRHESRPVGFSVSLRSGDELDGLLVGMADDAVVRPLCLYQNVLYDFIDDAIAHGCRGLHLGRTALEIKSTVGAQPSHFDVYVRHPGPLLHAALGLVLDRLPETPWQPRHAFKRAPAG